MNWDTVSTVIITLILYPFVEGLVGLAILICLGIIYLIFSVIKRGLK